MNDGWQMPAEVLALDAEAELTWLPCGDGELPIRRWPGPGDRVVLLHGGSGSWLHWIRNIAVLRTRFDVYAVDLPGLGDAAMCSIPSDADSAAEALSQALTLRFDGGFHIVAFSWGCTLTAMLMRPLAHRLKSVMLTGPAAVGNLPRQPQMKPLIKRAPEMSVAEVLATQRENLRRLMIHDPARIDDLAVRIQTANTSKARFSSPRYARSMLVADGIRDTTTPLFVIYGDQDAPAFPELEARRVLFQSLRPDVMFELIPGAGHWLQYEQPEIFNARCLAWLASYQ